MRLIDRQGQMGGRLRLRFGRVPHMRGTTKLTITLGPKSFLTLKQIIVRLLSLSQVKKESGWVGRKQHQGLISLFRSNGTVGLRDIFWENQKRFLDARLTTDTSLCGRVLTLSGQIVRMILTVLYKLLSIKCTGLKSLRRTRHGSSKGRIPLLRLTRF